VLDGRADALLLRAGDIADCDIRGKKRIFAEVFEVVLAKASVEEMQLYV